MSITESEAGLLFSKNNLLAINGIDGLILIPINSKLTTGQSQILQKLTSSIGLKPGKIKFFYYQGSFSSELLLSEISKFSPSIALVFGHLDTSEIEPAIEKRDDCHSVFLPEIAKIETNLDCKKAVWKVLKPLALT